MDNFQAGIAILIIMACGAAIWALIGYIRARLISWARQAFYLAYIFCQISGLRFSQLAFKALFWLEKRNRLFWLIGKLLEGLLSIGLAMIACLAMIAASGLKRLIKGNWLCKLIYGLLIIPLAIAIFASAAYLLIPIFLLARIERGIEARWGIKI